MPGPISISRVAGKAGGARGREAGGPRRASERRAGRQEATGVGHRARSLPFITEPTSHTTSSPQIRDVLFFSLPSTLFSYAPRQIDRTPTPRLRPQSPPHRTWDLDLYLDPDLILCCTHPARPLPTRFSVQEVVSSLPRRSTTSQSIDVHLCLPIWRFVRQTARDKDTEERKSARQISKTVASCELPNQQA